MKERLIHTPEGVRDIYNGECARKNLLSERMKDVLKSYGYRDIQTPTFEFFDIFNQDKGSLPSNQMYKFFDREGNTLVLRPDITPSIARAVSKYYSDETFSMRFSYTGNIFINNSSLQGRMKESTQMGAELIGDDSIDADAEMIALAIHLLLAAGLKEFQIDVGHVGFFNGLIKEAGMDEEKAQKLRELIENKNYFGVEALTD
ncbi:ATP phosphoribosyltransferase regulatory subunit, partial [Frisingicoccus sp.]